MWQQLHHSAFLSLCMALSMCTTAILTAENCACYFVGIKRTHHTSSRKRNQRCLGRGLMKNGLQCREWESTVTISFPNIRGATGCFYVLQNCNLSKVCPFLFLFVFFSLSRNTENSEEATIIEDEFTYEKRPRSVLCRKLHESHAPSPASVYHRLRCSTVSKGPTHCKSSLMQSNSRRPRTAYSINCFLHWENATWQWWFRVSA